MQALRTAAVVKGSLRVPRGRGVGGSRGAKGLGWYRRYQEFGPEAFRKTRRATSFDWENQHAVNEESETAGKRRRRAFLQFAVDGVDAGRVEFELASDLLPVTCENFLRLCKGVETSVRPKPALRYAGSQGDELAPGEETRTLCYKDTKIHRVVKGTGLMGGDVEHEDGKGSHSAFGYKFFPDEAFIIPHTEPGLLTTANSGVHSNGSQFFITTEEAEHLDGRSVAFGRVSKGMDVVNAIASLYCIRGKPVTEISVAKCGEV